MNPQATLSGAFLQSAGSTLPDALKTMRQQRATALADMPVPTRKTENWKYSSRHLQLDDSLAGTLVGGSSNTAFHNGDAYRVVIRNGQLDLDASELPDVSGVEVLAFRNLEDADAAQLAERLDNTLDSKAVQFARLNSARFEDGLLIRLAKNAVLDKPLFVFCENGGDKAGSAYPRIYVEAGQHSQLTLVEEYTSVGEAQALVNTVTEFSLADGANITSVRLTIEGQQTQHIGATAARLQANARFESHCVGFGGPLRRHDLRVCLEGKGAECKLNGVAVTQGQQHLDNHTVIEHVAPHCESEESYRNIAADKSHAVFNGRIHIHPDAQKSNANMSNKNLLLSTGAEIDTKPELEIYADDVKCAHGATVGQLDEESLFYLVSRGIDRKEAGTLLSMAFINELIEQIPVEPVRDAAHARLVRFIEQSFEGA
ncbi:MAG: Fe-S cluster assembly protein SufD [Marinobacter sp.]|nr:Fe-S cluster assembly protein SufD [Marinobacter sp.]